MIRVVDPATPDRLAGTSRMQLSAKSPYKSFVLVRKDSPVRDGVVQCSFPGVHITTHVPTRLQVVGEPAVR
jgi:hypothetical protein